MMTPLILTLLISASLAYVVERNPVENQGYLQGAHDLIASNDYIQNQAYGQDSSPHYDQEYNSGLVYNAENQNALPQAEYQTNDNYPVEDQYSQYVEERNAEHLDSVVKEQQLPTIQEEEEDINSENPSTKAKRCFHHDLVGATNRIQNTMRENIKKMRCNSCREMPKCKFQGDCSDCDQFCEIESSSSTSPVKIEQRSHEETEEVVAAKNEDSHDNELWENEDRYYTIGTFNHGPVKNLLIKLLQIVNDEDFDSFVILVRTRPKPTETESTHPIIIDTAHVFTKNEETGEKVDIDVHNVNENFDLNLTQALDDDLEKAIVDKKNAGLGSFLTDKEIDNVIKDTLLKNKNGALQPHSKETSVKAVEGLNNDDNQSNESSSNSKEKSPIVGSKKEDKSKEKSEEEYLPYDDSHDVYRNNDANEPRKNEEDEPEKDDESMPRASQTESTIEDIKQINVTDVEMALIDEVFTDPIQKQKFLEEMGISNHVVDTTGKITSAEESLINKVFNGRDIEEVKRRDQFLEQIKKMKEKKNQFRKTVLDTILPDADDPKNAKMKENIMDRLINKAEQKSRSSTSSDTSKLSKFNEFFLEQLFNATAKEEFLGMYNAILARGETTPEIRENLFDQMVIDRKFANDHTKTESQKKKWLVNFKNEVTEKYNLQEVGVVNKVDETVIEDLLKKLCNFFPKLMTQHAMVVASATEAIQKSLNSTWSNLTKKQQESALTYEGDDLNDEEDEMQGDQGDDSVLNLNEILHFLKSLSLSERKTMQNLMSSMNNGETVGQPNIAPINIKEFAEFLRGFYRHLMTMEAAPLNTTDSADLPFWIGVWNNAWQKMNETQKQEILKIGGDSSDSARSSEIIDNEQLNDDNYFQYDDIVSLLKYLDVVNRPLKEFTQVMMKYNPDLKSDEELYTTPNEDDKTKSQNATTNEIVYQILNDTVTNHTKLMLLKPFLFIDLKNLTHWKDLWDHSWDSYDKNTKDVILDWNEDHLMLPGEKFGLVRGIKNIIIPYDVITILKTLDVKKRKQLQGILRDKTYPPAKPAKNHIPPKGDMASREDFLRLLESKFSFLYKNISGWYYPQNHSKFSASDENLEEMEQKWLAEKWVKSWDRLTPPQQEHIIHWKSPTEVAQEQPNVPVKPIDDYFDVDALTDNVVKSKAPHIGQEAAETFNATIADVVVNFNSIKNLLKTVDDEERKKMQAFIQLHYDGISMPSTAEAATTENNRRPDENKSVESQESAEDSKEKSLVAAAAPPSPRIDPPLRQFDVAGVRFDNSDYYDTNESDMPVVGQRLHEDIGEIESKPRDNSHETQKKTLEDQEESIEKARMSNDEGVVGCKKKDDKDKDHDHHHHPIETIYYEPIDTYGDDYYRSKGDSGEEKVDSEEVESFKDTFFSLEEDQKDLLRKWDFNSKENVEKTDENMPAYNIINFLKSLKPKQQRIMKNIINTSNSHETDEVKDVHVDVPKKHKSESIVGDSRTMVYPPKLDDRDFKYVTINERTNINPDTEAIHEEKVDETPRTSDGEDVVGCKKKKEEEEDYNLAHYVFRPLIYYPPTPKKQYKPMGDSYTYEEQQNDDGEEEYGAYRNAGQEPATKLGRTMDKAADAFSKIYKSLAPEEQDALKNWRLGQELPMEKTQHTMPLFNMIQKIKEMNPLQRQRLHDILKENLGQNETFSRILNPMLQPRNEEENTVTTVKAPMVGASFEEQVGSKPDWALDETNIKKVETDYSKFGRLRPQNKKSFDTKNDNSMYFEGEGLKLPLIMKPLPDGSFHLSVDIDTLCGCKDNMCKKRLTREALEKVLAVNEELQKPATMQKLESMHMIPSHLHKRSIHGNNRIKTASGEIVIEHNDHSDENDDITYKFDKKTEIPEELFKDGGRNVLEDILAGDNYIQQKMKLFKNLLSFWKNFSLESRNKDN